MKFALRFRARDFTDTFVPPPVEFEVESYSWSDVGGPDKASVNVRGGRLDLWLLAEMLRLPVEIYDELGAAVWWGYIHKVTINDGPVKSTVSLDTMFNRVAVAYSKLDAGSSGAGARNTTAWASDADSSGEFGTKEKVESLNEATDAQAQLTRDNLLALWRYPAIVDEWSDGKEGLSAQLECRGWWGTLDWRFYSNAGTGAVETTTQLSTIVGAMGQFITGVDIEAASGISTNEYRDGDASALRSVEELLKGGTSGGIRLLTTVTQSRRLRVYAEPSVSSPRYTRRADGQLYDGLVLVPKWTAPVAEWVQLEEVIPDVVNVTRLINASKRFISKSEYVVGRDALNITTRNTVSPFEALQKAKVQLRDPKDMQPYVMKWVGGEGGSGGGFAPSPHDLDGPDHAGTLGDVQAPQFLTLDGSRSMLGPVKFGVVPDVEVSRKSVDTLQLGNNDQLESTTFTSGLAGFRIGANGDAEFNNVVSRGELRASVFTVGEVHADGGTVLIVEAGTLALEVTTH